MDVQIIISIRAINILFKDHVVSIIMSRINILPLSYAAFQDRDLMNDLERFTALYNLLLNMTYLISYLLHLLLIY